MIIAQFWTSAQDLLLFAGLACACRYVSESSRCCQRRLKSHRSAATLPLADVACPRRLTTPLDHAA